MGNLILKTHDHGLRDLARIRVLYKTHHSERVFQVMRHEEGGESPPPRPSFRLHEGGAFSLGLMHVPD